MGKYITKVGKIRAQYGDYQWDYIKDNQSLDYYKNYNFEVELYNEETEERETVKVPILSNFIEVKELKKNYTYAPKEGDLDNLFIWLFEKVSTTETLYAKIYLSTHFGEYPTKHKKFYMSSEIGAEEIILTDKENNSVEVKSLDDIRWINNNGLRVEWV